MVGLKCFLDIQVEMPTGYRENVDLRYKFLLFECNLYNTNNLWLIECQKKNCERF